MSLVYLVATGEVIGGLETYTRHEQRPPLCDAEALHTGADDDLCDELRKEGYAEGRYDEREQIAKDLLPGSYYMDQSDGGDVSLPQQLIRMADDASKWRAHIALNPLPGCAFSDAQFQDRVLRMLTELEDEGILTEGQCAEVWGGDLLDWRIASRPMPPAFVPEP